MACLRQILLSLGIAVYGFVLMAQSHPVINEIMVNPNNGTLPPYEWIELYNPSSEPLHLVLYDLTYNDRHFPLPDIYLPARQYLILTATDHEAAFLRFGNVHGLASWPVLSNTGATIGLFHRIDGTVDELSYSNRWYSSPQKRQGGWSLERINPHLTCNPASNWIESEALEGGTPGQRNSLFNERDIPKLEIREFVVEGAELHFVFNADVEAMVVMEEIRSMPETGNILSITKQKDTVTIVLDRDLQEGRPYLFEFSGLFCDVAFLVEHSVFIDNEINFNDVIINEVLFNPKPGGVDFVEIYNRSDKIVNLQHWRLGNRLLSSELCLFEPDTYYIITTDVAIIQEHYPSAVLDQVIVLPSLPAYANQQGIVTLYEGDRLIDSLYYQVSMHQPFVTNTRGISLERQSSELGTNAPNNFTSASTYTEGATPGYENSKNHDEKKEKNKIFLSSKTVSPDGDQVEDELIVHYDFEYGNVMVNLFIYNDRGRLVNRLIRNQNVGFTGQFIWDGMMENGEEAPSGIYLCIMEIYNETGVHHVFRESFVLVRRGQGY